MSRTALDGMLSTAVLSSGLAETVRVGPRGGTLVEVSGVVERMPREEAQGEHALDDVEMARVVVASSVAVEIGYVVEVSWDAAAEFVVRRVERQGTGLLALGCEKRERVMKRRRMGE